ncbi:MAG: hypothetical protein QXM16_09135, partial [Nitrososphaerota archaeon]
MGGKDLSIPFWIQGSCKSPTQMGLCVCLSIPFWIQEQHPQQGQNTASEPLSIPFWIQVTTSYNYNINKAKIFQFL